MRKACVAVVLSAVCAVAGACGSSAGAPSASRSAGPFSEQGSSTSASSESLASWVSQANTICANAFADFDNAYVNLPDLPKFSDSSGAEVRRDAMEDAQPEAVAALQAGADALSALAAPPEARAYSDRLVRIWQAAADTRASGPTATPDFVDVELYDLGLKTCVPDLQAPARFDQPGEAISD